MHILNKARQCRQCRTCQMFRSDASYALRGSYGPATTRAPAVLLRCPHFCRRPRCSSLCHLLTAFRNLCRVSQVFIKSAVCVNRHQQHEVPCALCVPPTPSTPPARYASPGLHSLCASPAPPTLSTSSGPPASSSSNVPSAPCTLPAPSAGYKSSVICASPALVTLLVPPSSFALPATEQFVLSGMRILLSPSASGKTPAQSNPLSIFTTRRLLSEVHNESAVCADIVVRAT